MRGPGLRGEFDKHPLSVTLTATNALGGAALLPGDGVDIDPKLPGVASLSDVTLHDTFRIPEEWLRSSRRTRKRKETPLARVSFQVDSFVARTGFEPVPPP